LRVEPDHFYARTSLLVRVLTLFFSGVYLHVDRRARYLFLDRRYFWFFKRSRAIAFAQIDRIEYGFDSTVTKYGYQGQALDQVETFTVEIVLKEGDEHIPLFRFRGLGAVSTGLTGLMQGDDLVDYEGDQERKSLAFVQALKDFLGVPLGKAVPQLTDESGTKYSCGQCGRPGPPRQGDCLYCGGKLKPER